MKNEQTTVTVGSLCAERIRFSLNLTSEYIGKVEKQLLDAKVVKDEGEVYSEYSKLFFGLSGGGRIGKWGGQGIGGRRLVLC